MTAFLVAASLANSLTRRFAQKRRTHQGVALLLARLVHASIVVIGFLIGLSVIAPSFQASDLIKLLGIGTVAVGFAFQNILQNFLAGILLLLQEPFQLGEFISVTGIEGHVSDIQARATFIAVRVDRAENLGVVADSIDESFHNAEFETATLTESDTLANYVSAIGDLRTIIYTLCLVVLTTLLLIAANSMTMLVRDRTNEVAVMRVLGFTRRHVAVLLISEAVLIAVG